MAKKKRGTEPVVEFGELRSLLQRAPSRGLWYELIGALRQGRSRAPEARVERYVRDHLARWPVGLRPALPAWGGYFFEGLEAQPTPELEALLGMVDALSLRRDQADWWGHTPEQMSEHGRWQRVRALSIWAQRQPGAPSFRWIGQLGQLVAQLPELRRLRMHRLPFGEEGARLLVESLRGHPGLEVLALEDAGLTALGVEALAELEAPALHRLSLNNNTPGGAGIEALAAAGWTALRELSLRQCHLSFCPPELLAESLGALERSARARRLLEPSRRGRAVRGATARPS